MTPSLYLTKISYDIHSNCITFYLQEPKRKYSKNSSQVQQSLINRKTWNLNKSIQRPKTRFPQEYYSMSLAAQVSVLVYFLITVYMNSKDTS